MAGVNKNTTTLLKIVLSILLIAGTCWIGWNYYDVRYFMEWVAIAERNGVLSIYALADKCGYMPLAPLVFIASYEAAKELAGLLISSLSSAMLGVDYYRFVVKLPLILSILATGLAIYRRDGWDVAKWWFYGIPIWVVVWAYQFDPLMVLFMVIGFYKLVDRRYCEAGLWLGIGAAFKYVPALLVPLALKAMRSFKDRVKFLASFMIPPLLVALPFIAFDASGFINQTLGFHMSRYPQMLSIFNIPQLLNRFEAPPWLKAVSNMWLPLFLVSYTLGLLLIPVREGDRDSINNAALYLILTFIVFNKVHNNNYLLWAYPFIAYWVARKERMIKALFILACVIGNVYPSLLCLLAATLDKPIFIEEDKVWYNAQEILLNSVEGSARATTSKVLRWLSRSARDEISWMYTNFNIMGTIMIVVYNAILLYFMVLAANDVGLRSRLRELGNKVYTVISRRHG